MNDVLPTSWPTLTIPLGGEETNQVPQVASGLNVVIDALNHDLAGGTGIATYSRNMAATLQVLGHEVSWLYGRSGHHSYDGLMNELSFFREPPPETRLRRAARLANLVGDVVRGPSAKAYSLKRTPVIVRDPTEIDGLGTFNSPDLFQRAHHRHVRLGLFTSLSFDAKVDVLHLTSPLPLRARHAATVTTIHDLIPLRLPYTTLDDKHEILRRLRRASVMSDLIFTVSAASRDDIVRLLDVDPAKVVVTYQTSDMSPLSDRDLARHEGVLARYGLEPQKYALFVGAIEPKKNLRRLVEAFLEIDTQTQLVIVGRKAWMWEKDLADIETLYGVRAAQRLRFMGYLPREDLRHIYASALLMAFPSLYEGFGLPVLEAMQCGCPVLTSHSSSLPEVGGEAALYCNPFDVGDIRQKLEQLLSDEDLRRRCSTLGLVQASKFSFEIYARRLKDAYAQIR